MKKYIKHILITLIILSILYFIYRFYEEKKVQEGFEGLDTQASSVYYKNTVDSNDLQTKIFSRNITKSVLEPDVTAALILDSSTDLFTGTYKEADTPNQTLGENYSILVLRKIGDQVQFTLSKNDVTYQTAATSNISNNTLPYYSLIGIAQIDSNTNGQISATVISIKQNNYNTSLTNSDIINQKIIVSGTLDPTTKKPIYNGIYFLGKNYSIVKRDYQLAGDESNFGIGNKIFTYNKDIIQPYYEMEATQFSDVNCAPGKKLCTFTPSGSTGITGYACTTGTVTNGMCPISTGNYGTGTTINSSFMCSLGTKDSSDNYTNSNNNLSKTENNVDYSLTNCDPQYNIVMNGKMDMMMNKIDNGNDNLNSCTYLKNLTTNWDHYYILYFRNLNDVTSLSFQYWGESPNESRLVTIRTKLDQAIKDNTDIQNCVKKILGATKANDTSQPILNNKASTNSPVEWKLTSDLGNNSCYFTIGSKKTPTKPTYYLQSESNGLVHVSLFEGGINKYFTLEQYEQCTDSYSNINIYSGYLRASNGLYLSPGISSITELDPSSTNTDARVCTLVSKPNVAGKWVIIGSNVSFTEDDLSGLTLNS